MSVDIIDGLTNAQLDRLQDRLTGRVNQRLLEKLEAEREKSEPQPLRPHIGNAGIGFGDALSRRAWDQLCLDALKKQTVPFAVAPMTGLVARDGSRLPAGAELRPSEHLDARNGDVAIQLERLVESGHVLAKTGAL